MRVVALVGEEDHPFQVRDTKDQPRIIPRGETPRPSQSQISYRGICPLTLTSKQEIQSSP